MQWPKVVYIIGVVHLLYIKFGNLALDEHLVYNRFAKKG